VVGRWEGGGRGWVGAWREGKRLAGRGGASETGIGGKRGRGQRGGEGGGPERRGATEGRTRGLTVGGHRRASDFAGRPWPSLRRPPRLAHSRSGLSRPRSRRRSRALSMNLLWQRQLALGRARQEMKSPRRSVERAMRRRAASPLLQASAAGLPGSLQSMLTAAVARRTEEQCSTVSALDPDQSG